MRYRIAIVVVLSVLIEYPKVNLNVGGGIGINQGELRDLLDTSGVFVLGGGWDFSRLVGTSVEYQYYNVAIKDSLIAGSAIPDVTGRMDSLTGNAIVRPLSGERAGVYVIGGVGWYRSQVRAQVDTLQPGTVCLESWFFWGVVCTNGIVETTQVLSEEVSNDFGVNIGAGFTVGLGEGLKFYTEVRHHRIDST